MIKMGKPKTFHEIRVQCLAQGVPLNARNVEDGWDTIVVGAMQPVDGRHGGHVIYNTFNGHFFGQTPAGEQFDSNESKWDKFPWFVALLNFFYHPKRAK